MEQAIYQLVAQMAPYLPTEKRVEGKPDEALPPLGEVLAIDGSVFPSHGNGNRRTGDEDADWGFKHSVKTNGQTELMFGYSMHLISDVVHGIPLAFTLTPANGSEYTEFPLVVEKVIDVYPWLHPKYMVVDDGYDNEDVHKDLFD